MIVYEVCLYNPEGVEYSQLFKDEEKAIKRQKELIEENRKELAQFYELERGDEIFNKIYSSFEEYYNFMKNEYHVVEREVI